MRRRAALLLPCVLLFGCDQMRMEPVAELPPELDRGAGDPARFAAETAASAFLDRERALAGDPAGAAFACAMLENAATAFQDAGRFSDGPWVTRLLREGRAALRATLGIAEGALPQQAQDALLAAAAAFRRGSAEAAAAALTPIASRNARPAEALGRLEVPSPLRRALRETRAMLNRQNTSQGG